MCHDLVDPVIERTQGELAFRLDVGLSGDVDPLWERDLDNVLFRLRGRCPRGSSRCGDQGPCGAVVRAAERAVEVAEPMTGKVEVPRGPGNVSVRQRCAGGRGVPELAAGPVALDRGVSRPAVTGWRQEAIGRSA